MIVICISRHVNRSNEQCLNLIDPIFNKEDNNYYLTTPFEDKYVYIFNKDLYAVKPTALRNIKPVICIDKKSIKSGDGSLNNPYVVEVK